MLNLKAMKSVGMPVQPMSMKTRDFIQKICYRRTASVDMTQYGFITDSRMQPICLMLRPLKERLKNICDKKPEESLVIESSGVKNNKKPEESLVIESGGVKKGKAPKRCQNRARQKKTKLIADSRNPAQANAKKIIYEIQKRTTRIAKATKDVPHAKDATKLVVNSVRFKLN